MFISDNVVETEETGARFGQGLRAGHVVAIAGDLGSGKTQFVKGLARGLGSKDVVTSPTFTLMHEYRSGRLPLYHFDFYRLENVDALRAIGFDEYLFGDGVTVIEWADKFASAIPERARWVTFEIASDNSRLIDFARRKSPLPGVED
jgi:tRNA threonylcarbamoyladenosine biosynthesis protein TsaE